MLGGRNPEIASMSLIEIARDALKEIPVSDILRERLALALDLAAKEEAHHEETKAHLARSEAHHEDTKAQLARSDADLERERLDHQKTREELQRLKDEHAEEIRIHHTVEFRRGKRTGGEWIAFCPKCHLPATDFPTVRCSEHPKCGWLTLLGPDDIAKIAATL